MKVVKYKKSSNGLYKVELDDGRVLSLYEDVILKNNLLIKKEISDDEISKANLENLEYEVYYVALKSIKSRFKSVYELSELLKKKDYSIDNIDKAIDKLIKQGYLNDREFTRSYINNQMITTSKGPLKIMAELSNKHVDKDIIDDEIIIFDEETQIEKVTKLIEKRIKSNRTRGGDVLRKKIFMDIKLFGYDNSIINKVINEFEFDNSSWIAKREYDKLYKRLCRKYSGVELENKIKEKLYQKGLSYEE